jgi:gluconokinase
MVVVLFGVTGSGKTTIGELLSRQLNWTFYDADDYHSKSNVEKMKQGIPLTDVDRKPWLESLRELIEQCLDKGENAALACSALKESYREVLKVNKQVNFFLLKADFKIIQERLQNRKGHYMNPGLLQSQFDAFEEPSVQEDVHIIDVNVNPEEVVRNIRRQIGV